MHFRVSTRRKGDRVYRYGQLVQSYRRDDGMPAHRVVLSLGPVTDIQAENFRLLFRANQGGQRLVVTEDKLSNEVRGKCDRNLVYLPLAVWLRMAQRWHLRELLEELAPESNVEMPVSDVVLALVMQRGFAPESKIEAVRWVPNTALPELMGFSSAQFNNTRVHRAMEVLESIEGPLQEALSGRVAAAKGPLRVLYLDCTDTWFEGQGPPSACWRGTKEGLFRRRVGIVLLCDHRGLPLRWATVPGDFGEAPTMLSLLRAISGEPWARDVPLVMDRAMGNAATLESLSELGLRFVTAVPRSEFATWSGDIPMGQLDDVHHDDPEQMLQALADRMVGLGFEPLGDGGRFVRDLGVIRHGATRPPGSARLASTQGASRAQAALRLVQRMRAAVDHGVVESMSAYARKHGVTRQAMSHWGMLEHLTPDLQQRIMDGEADRVLPSDLQRMARLDAEAQAAAFAKAVAAAGPGRALRPTRNLARLAELEPLQARAVVSFRPELFVRQRAAAQARVDDVRSAIQQLNQRLRSPHSRRSSASALADAGAHLRRQRLQSVFDLQVHTERLDGRSVLQVVLTLDEAAWRARRAPDGFNLLVAHPDYVGSPQNLVDHYFGKDLIEKDFRTIKSVLSLRPVHHRTDPKVRAHVTLCVLALLLERTLEARLHEAGLDMSADRVRSTLSSCMLNHFKGLPLYTSTTPTPDQLAILNALDLDELVDDEAIGESIHAG